MLLNYYESDAVIEQRIQENQEYQYKKTKLKIVQNARRPEQYQVKARTGIFRVKFQMRMGFGQMMLVKKLTIEKLISAVLAVGHTLLTALLIFACIETYEPNMGIDIIYFIVLVSASGVVTYGLWRILADLYTLIPEEVVLRYFYGTIFRQEALETKSFSVGRDNWEYDSKHMKMQADGTYFIDDSMYVKENVTESMRKKGMLERVYRVIGTVIPLFIIAFMCLYPIKMGNEWRALAGVALLIKGLFGVAVLLLWKQRDREIAQNAMPYDATVVGIAYRKRSKKYKKIYEFKDNHGYWHRVQDVVVGTRKSGENAQAWIGKQTRIWYAPQFHSDVLQGEMCPQAYINMNDKSTKRVMAVVALAVIFFSSGVLGIIEKGPADPVGESLKVEWAREYVDTGLRQEDIESDTVQWMCSTYALRAETDGGELYTIGVFEPTEDNVAYVREYLRNTWNISDRTSAIDTMNSLLEYGSRSGYRDFVEKMEQNGWFELSGKEVSAKIASGEVAGKELRYRGAYDAYQEFGEKGIDAWDYCRLIRIAGNCYVAGYITLEECMDQCLPVARELQREFDSWEEVNQSYLYGYMYWAQTGDSAETVVEMWGRRERALMQLEDGPYSLEFDMELVDTWN